MSIPAKAQLVSFKVVHKIAKCIKLLTIAEELILFAAIDLVSTMTGDSAVQELKIIPLSNKTICRRIEKIANDINMRNQLVISL